MCLEDINRMNEHSGLKIMIIVFKSFMMIMLSASYMNMISLIQAINCLVTGNITSLLMDILTQLPCEIKCFPGRMGEDWSIFKPM